MKIIGALMLVISGIFLGIYMSGKLKKREEKLLELKKMMRKLKTEISYMSEDIHELIAGNTEYSFCREAVRHRCFVNDPKKALKDAGREILLTETDRSLYLEFISGLGVSDIAGQIEHFELYGNLLENNLLSAREDIVKKSRLYLALGFFGGITICLILI